MGSRSLFDYSSNSGTSLFDANSLAFDPSMTGVGLMSSLSSTNFLGSSNTVEPNSPELFRHNVKAALNHAEYLRRRIESCIANIQQAYYSSSNSQQSTVEIKLLRDEVEAFVNHLVSSGVGSLPLLYGPNEISRRDAPRHKKEEELLALMSSAVSALYAKQKQIQENNAVVANLLSIPEAPKK